MPSYFQILESLHQSFGDCTKSTNYNWYHCHFMSQFFQFSSKVQLLIFLFTFFQFYSVVSRDSKVHNLASFLFFVWLSLGLVFWPRLDDPFVSQNPRRGCASHYPRQILGCAYTIYFYGQISISDTIPVDHLPHPVVSCLIFFLW